MSGRLHRIRWGWRCAARLHRWRGFHDLGDGVNVQPISGYRRPLGVKDFRRCDWCGARSSAIRCGDDRARFFAWGHTVRPSRGSVIPGVSPEDLARRFHETYERLAPLYGYETRRESAVPWGEVPAQNRALMVAVAAEILGAPPLFRRWVDDDGRAYVADFREYRPLGDYWKLEESEG